MTAPAAGLNGRSPEEDAHDDDDADALPPEVPELDPADVLEDDDADRDDDQADDDQADDDGDDQADDEEGGPDPFETAPAPAGYTRVRKKVRVDIKITGKGLGERYSATKQWQEDRAPERLRKLITRWSSLLQKHDLYEVSVEIAVMAHTGGGWLREKDTCAPADLVDVVMDEMFGDQHDGCWGRYLYNQVAKRERDVAQPEPEPEAPPEPKAPPSERFETAEELWGALKGVRQELEWHQEHARAVFGEDSLYKAEWMMNLPKVQALLQDKTFFGRLRTVFGNKLFIDFLEMQGPEWAFFGRKLAEFSYFSKFKEVHGVDPRGGVDDGDTSQGG